VKHLSHSSSRPFSFAFFRRASTTASAFVVGLCVAAPAVALAPAPGDQGIAAPLESVSFTSVEFASGALITGNVECYTGCVAQDIVFTDLEGNVLEGTFVDVSATRPDLGFAWQSTTPLAPGTYYASLPSGYQTSSFTVVEATDEVPTFTPGVVASTSGALFGSVLRDDFRPDSDIDVLVTFAPTANWSLFDHVRMNEELNQLLNRKADLLSRRAVEQSHNQPRRQVILDTASVVYAFD
jgi:predicted nucleotidyltransferase